jgi:hypothetical protein
MWHWYVLELLIPTKNLAFFSLSFLCLCFYFLLQVREINELRREIQNIKMDQKKKARSLKTGVAANPDDTAKLQEVDANKQQIKALRARIAELQQIAQPVLGSGLSMN